MFIWHFLHVNLTFITLRLFDVSKAFIPYCTHFICIYKEILLLSTKVLATSDYGCLRFCTIFNKVDIIFKKRFFTAKIYLCYFWVEFLASKGLYYIFASAPGFQAVWNNGHG